MPTTLSEKRSSAVPALILGVIVGLLAALLAVPAVVRHVGASMRNRISMAFLGRHDTIDV